MPEPASEPMSWGAPGSVTPGALAVRLRKARSEVERIVFHIADSQRSFPTTAELNQAYGELAEAARALVFAQNDWDDHVAKREASR